MQKMLIATLLGATSLLTACQSLSPEEIRFRDQQRCQGYGFKMGSEGMAKCLLDLDMDRSAESREIQSRMHRDFMARPMIVERRVIIERN